MEERLFRWGNFSSSSIHCLVAPGKREMTEMESLHHRTLNPKSKAKLIEDDSLFSTAGETYIEEKGWEKELRRSIDVEKDSQATLWGKLLEPMVNMLLPEDYRLMSKKRFAHPTIPNWSGMPDIITPTKVGDIKCPEPKAFMKLLQVFKMERKSLEANLPLKPGHFLKEYSPEYYWQLVSNGILVNRNIAELIVFMPKEHRLMDIRKMCEEEEDFVMQEKFKRIYYANAESLALMPDDCTLDELNIFQFEIPEEDKLLLTNKIIAANKRLAA